MLAPLRVVTCGAAIVVATVLAGCQMASTRDSGGGTGIPCPTAGDPVELAALAFDATPDTFVTLSGGRYRLTAEDFRHDGPFVPPTGRTEAVWGPRETTPTYAPGPATVTGTSGSVHLVEGAPVVLELPEGTWWFLNSSFVPITLEPCDGATARIEGDR